MARPRCTSRSSSGRKRKAADAVQHPGDDEAPPTRSRQRLQQQQATDEDAMLFAQILEREMEQQMSQEAAGGDEDDAMSLAQMLEAEMEMLCEDHDETTTGGEPAAAPPEEEDDDVMEISLDEFLLGSSSAPRAPPSCAAHRQENAAPSRASTSSYTTTPRHGGQSTDSDVVKVSPVKLMGFPASASGLFMSTSEQSPLTDDDDDSDDKCGGLACPPMDDAYVELILSKPFVQFDPAFVEDFINDL